MPNLSLPNQAQASSIYTIYTNYLFARQGKTPTFPLCFV